MARAYSQDLRDRVIDAALAGLSARGAAERFGIGEATAIVWVRRARQTGERQARRSKPDAHRDDLLVIEATPDMTISELLERLLTERGVKARRAALWIFSIAWG
ncbi:IS630 transposase-related protein [Methylocystis sp. SC2]|uniref:IS630 transposase-related protein n=1 Tax=Methylocystis sp. (strain SC2) TaxID=187303 RepID=UPI00027AEE4E|nr:IS630 transposase-related protein [Methylocystis sp. SC2]CCJ06990.1 Transposase of insertion sequence ISRm10-1, orfA protein [Methylocystis sp. SC2]